MDNSPTKQASEMLTKQEILAAAEELPFVTSRNLGRLFDQYAEWGLVSGIAAKASRRGGEGLYHVAQKYLFLNMLWQRAHKVRLETLANWPVGGWILGVDGIPLDQARKAFRYWLQHQLPAGGPHGPDSTHQRTIDAQIAKLATPDTPKGPKQKLDRQIKQALDTFGSDVHQPVNAVECAVEFNVAILDTAFPEDWRFDGYDKKKGLADVIRGTLEQKASGWRYREFLDTRLADDWWEWARRFIQEGLQMYVADLTELRSDPDLARFYEIPTMASFLVGSCSHLLQVFGIGFDARTSQMALPSGLKQPPALPE